MQGDYKHLDVVTLRIHCWNLGVYTNNTNSVMVLCPLVLCPLCHTSKSLGVHRINSVLIKSVEYCLIHCSQLEVENRDFLKCLKESL